MNLLDNATNARAVDSLLNFETVSTLYNHYFGLIRVFNMILYLVFAGFLLMHLMLLYLCLPPTGSGDILFFPVRLSVCLSVRHKLCPLYNLKTVKDFSMKLGTLVNHDETMCHAQEP